MAARLSEVRGADVTPEEVLTSEANMKAAWLRGIASALRDPKTRDQEAKHIVDFPWSFAVSLESAIDLIERLNPETKPPTGLWWAL